MDYSVTVLIPRILVDSVDADDAVGEQNREQRLEFVHEGRTDDLTA